MQLTVKEGGMEEVGTGWNERRRRFATAKIYASPIVYTYYMYV